MTETADPIIQDQPARTEPADDHVRLAEGLLFASTQPVPSRTLAGLLPEDADADAVLAALRDRYAGRGVELAEVAGAWQFRTAPDLAPRLKRVVQVPRRLPRAAMETLAIVAYHQPCTRTDIEEIRGTSLSQSTLDALLEAGLVAPRGRKEVPGRPTLWGTTPSFLQQFGLGDLRDLPKREDLLVETPGLTATSQAQQELPAEDTPEAHDPEAHVSDETESEALEPEAPDFGAPDFGAPGFEAPDFDAPAPDVPAMEPAPDPEAPPEAPDLSEPGPR